ncbi:MAG TPA: hypothetical protein VF796_18580 [Humisphaera sp.]
MSRAPIPLAVKADYADALTTIRRAKSLLVLLVLALLLGQVAAFLLARFDVLRLVYPPDAARPAVDAAEVLRYALPVTTFLAMVLAVVLCVVMLLLTTAMLTGRLMGVSHATGAFLWAVLLLAVLFPWQSVLVYEDRPGPPAAAGSVAADRPAVKWFGATVTYAEVLADHKFANTPLPEAIRGWGRYVGWPGLAVLVLLVVQAKGSRALRYALGEADLHVELTERTDGVGS